MTLKFFSKYFILPVAILNYILEFSLLDDSLLVCRNTIKVRPDGGEIAQSVNVPCGINMGMWSHIPSTLIDLGVSLTSVTPAQGLGTLGRKVSGAG